MHLNSEIFLALLGLKAILAHPHHHRHEKRVDYSDPSLYANIDWTKVDYGKGASPPPAQPAPQQQAAAQSPAENEEKPKPSPKTVPVVQQKNKNEEANDAPEPAPRPNTNGGGSKRGLAYNYESPKLDMFNSYKKLTWGHNWDSNPTGPSNPGGLSSQYDYVPTLRSLEPERVARWDSDVKKAAAGGGIVYLMSMNEPDIPEQANMGVGAAVEAYNKYMKPHAGGNIKLGSPSVSNGEGNHPTTGQPLGLDWLKPFLKQCNACPIDFIPVHFYGCTNGCSTDTDVKMFKRQIGAAIDAAGGRPVWIPEIQCHGDGQAFLDEVLPWLDGQGGVERYAYFMAKEGFMTQGNSVTPIGVKFATG